MILGFGDPDGYAEVMVPRGRDQIAPEDRPAAVALIKRMVETTTMSEGTVFQRYYRVGAIEEGFESIQLMVQNRRNLVAQLFLPRYSEARDLDPRVAALTLQVLGPQMIR